MILIIIFAFLTAIFFAKKIENHFQYYKIIYPDRYKDANSIIEAMKRFYTINPIFFMPFFLKRQRKLEIRDKNLESLAFKIIRACYSFYIALVLLFISGLIYIKF